MIFAVNYNIFAAELFDVNQPVVVNSAGEQINSISEIKENETCIFKSDVTNTTLISKNFRLIVGYYENTRLVDCVSGLYTVESGKTVTAECEIPWSELFNTPDAHIECFVWSGDFSPLCERVEVSYGESGGLFLINEISTLDFETDVPSEFSGSSNITVVDDNGNKKLQLDGSGRYFYTPLMYPNMENFAISADFKQLDSSGWSTSVFGLGIYDYAGNESRRLSYVDRLTVSSTAYKDRFYFSEGSVSGASGLGYITMSDTMGLAGESGRETAQFNMMMVSVGDKLYSYARNSDGKVIWYNEGENVFDEFLFEDMRYETAGINLFTHSSKVLVDNINLYDARLLESIDLNLPEKMLVNTWYDITPYGISPEGTRCGLSVDALRFYCNSNNVVIENGQIMLLDECSVSVSAVLRDDITKAYISGTSEVVGIIEDTDYTSISCSVSNSSPKLGETVSFELTGVKADGSETITDYSVSYDDRYLSVDGNNVTVLKYGEHKLSFTVGDNTLSKTLNCAVTQDTVISENFENSNNCEYYINYSNDDIVVSDNGTYAMKLDNSMSSLWGNKSWKNYTVSGKFKADVASVESDAYTYGFELVMRAKSEKMIGGTNNISTHFVYQPVGDHGGYMRIGTFKKKVESIDNSKWHNFNVRMFDGIAIFSIDDEIMFSHMNTVYRGGFYAAANNCSVLIDDVSIKFDRNISDQQLITLLKFGDTLNMYETYDLTDLILLEINNGEGYVDTSGVVFTCDNDNVSIIDGIINFDDAMTEGDKIVVNAAYADEVYSAEFTISKPYATRTEFAKATIRERQESLAYRLSAFGDTISTSYYKPSLSRLPGTYAKMLLYPDFQDYTEVLQWHINEAQYQDTVVGRGSDGGDFVMLQLVLANYELKGKVNAQPYIWDEIKRYLTSVEYAREGKGYSENHMLVHYTIAMLCSELWSDDNVSGQSAQETHSEYKQYFINWYNNHIKYGFMEYNSAHYYFINLFALETLYNYSTDEELKQMAYDLINYICADTLDNNIGDELAGAQMRVYTAKTSTSTFKPLKLWFNLGNRVIDEEYDFVNMQISHALNSAFVPHDILFNQAADTQRSYENAETTQVYHLPTHKNVSSYVTRYTHITPDYVMGSKLSADEITDTSVFNYNSYQEIPWSVRFSGGSEKMIFGGIPASTIVTDNFYWVNTRQSVDKFKLMQKDNIMVGVYDNTSSEFVHFNIPKNEFEAFDELNGWIFIDNKDAFCAIKLLGNGEDSDAASYSWSEATTVSAGQKLCDVEAKVYSQSVAFVCETVNKAEYDGTFDEFKNDILNNTEIVYLYDDTKNSIEYTGLSKTCIKADVLNGKSYLNGELYEPDETILHSSPYLSGTLGVGEVKMIYGDSEYVIRSK